MRRRWLGLALTVPILATGCGTTEETASSLIRAFVASYKVGTEVVLATSVTSETKTYTQLGDEVQQVDGLHAQANTVATAGPITCRFRDDAQRTEVSSATLGRQVNRLVGEQTVWILPDSFGTTFANEPNVNVWGNPARGWIFFTEPSLDVLLATQASAQCDCNLDQYLRTVETPLYIFEEDRDSTEYVTTTVHSEGAGQTTDTVSTSIDDTATAARQRTLSTYVQFLLGDYIWQTGPLAGLYNGAVNYTATMFLPREVRPGDTWIDNAGNLWGAVALESIVVGGRTIEVLHVVGRGSTDVDLTVQGVAGWCVRYFDGQTSEFSARTNEVQKSAVLTDLCDNATDQRGTGWFNQVHIWLYRGIPVKYMTERVDVRVNEFGFAIPNDGNLPAPPDAGGLVGDCARYFNAAPNTTVTAADLYKPYALFQVTKTYETWMATSVREDATVQQEALATP